VRAHELPLTWLAEPPGSTTIAFGNAWLRQAGTALLLVPSIIVPEEYNVLINPACAEVRSITSAVLRHYMYDPRL